MLAVGCLLPVALMIAGAAVGGVIGGTSVGLWGGVAGLIVGLASAPPGEERVAGITRNLADVAIAPKPPVTQSMEPLP
jgi:tellurite resistance protein TehA-like permease